MTIAGTTGESNDFAAPMQELFTAGERSALVGFLAGYSGLTSDAYALDLRVYLMVSAARGPPVPGEAIGHRMFRT